MAEATVSFPIDVWRKAKGKDDLQAWILTAYPELDALLQNGGEEISVRYQLDSIAYPQKQFPILLEFSDGADDAEVIALIPQRGFFASGNTPEEAKTNLLRSMEEDYLRLRNQRDLLGPQLLSKLEFLERLF
ncbi:hypothetical protein HYR99_19550 [Candidatus Poribacteria bacterium]|nr:hypothetical protein [Candidatus Poribacteria bacterium]